MDIKNTLISIRESKGYSKRTVSEMTGIPYTTYIKYESGERKDVSMDALVKIANFYNVTTDYLLGRDDTPPNPVEMLSNDKLEQSLIDGYFKLPKEVRIKILEMIVEAVERTQQEKAPKIDVTYSKIYADEGGVSKKETPAGLPKISDFFDD